jgi:DNA-binding NtrC family response regulator
VDLYYRLRVVEIELPALSERQEDILPLAEHFLRVFAGGSGRDISGISPAAARALVRYRWPGNVRELRNVIERAVVLDRDGVIDADDLPSDLIGQRPASPVPVAIDDGLLDVPWKEAKRRFGAVYFRRALEAHDGHVSRTARATGISRRALTNHLRDIERLEE